ncbi:disease resistance protein Pik-2-like [Lolium rigidum]|uniref:disease resistance protein Pik-2-like n=1 Tax=Lolium rigidum TaxID=89674 RepID=UPI001F5C55D3|nr:disease resistance protein Pik-2-like [Lolium rigidum]
MEALLVTPAASLANWVLQTLVCWGVTAAADKVALVQVVRNDVKSIEDELPMMHALLWASSTAYTSGGGYSNRGGDRLQTAWVKQLRDLAFDIEDGLLEFMLLKGPWPWADADLSRVAKQIADLRVRVEALHERNTRYHACLRPDQHGDDDSEPALLDDWRHEAIIGREGNKKALAKLVRRDGATVVAVWGMAGVGKSSLARMLYDDSDLITCFDRRAWVTVPHALDGAQEFGRLLQEQIGEDGEQRCLVVVDDVSSHEEWEHVSRCLAANQAGGRVVVLVTTQEEDVARLCSGDGDVYELKPLPHKEAQKVLCQKVYKDAKYKLPNDMVKQAKFILERCRGIPLAIAAIGGLLANRPKVSSEWTTLQEHIRPELESAALDVKRIISLTYDGLPYNVKFFFLYMSIFPKNHEIRRTRLLRRWMAEVYIEKPHGMTLEQVAKSHYNKLINRRMIETSNKVGNSMTSEYCRVHDQILQIILPKSVEDIQLFIMDKHYNEAPQSNVRHLVLARQKRNEEKLTRIKLTCLRSLTVFGECPVSLVTRELRLLRVLDLEDTVGLTNEDLKDIGQLPHLRYLGLRGTDISELPSCLQNLRFLETLDVKDTKVTHLPAGIVYLENLSYLRVGVNFATEKMGEEKNVSKRKLLGTLADFVCGCHGSNNSESGCSSQFSVRAPEKIQKLSKLQVLGVVHIARSQEAKKLRKLTNLRKLGVHLDAVDKTRREFCSSLSSLVQLEQLEVHCESLEFLKGMTEPPSRRLVSLRLCGHLGNLPRWMSRLTNLSKIKLLRTGLKQEDIEVIGSLPNVILLGLWKESFGEECLSFGKGKFRMLKLLEIEGLKKVKTICIENDALPVLEKLRVRKCLELYNSGQGLFSVKSLKNLNELELTNCGDKLELEMQLRRQIIGFSNRPVLITRKYVVTWTEMMLNSFYRLI